MTKQTTIQAWQAKGYNRASEFVGKVELTETKSKVEFRFGRKHITRKMWVSEDGSEWVYYCDQFNELRTNGFERVLDFDTRYGIKC